MTLCLNFSIEYEKESVLESFTQIVLRWIFRFPRNFQPFGFWALFEKIESAVGKDIEH